MMYAVADLPYSKCSNFVSTNRGNRDKDRIHLGQFNCTAEYAEIKFYTIPKGKIIDVRIFILFLS